MVISEPTSTKKSFLVPLRVGTVRDAFGIINLGDRGKGFNPKKNLEKLPGRKCRIISKAEQFLRVANRD